MKRFAKYIMATLIMVWLTGFFWVCNWQPVSFWGTQLSKDMQYKTQSITDDKTQLWDQVSVDEKDNTILIRLLWIFGLDTDRGREHKFLDYAKAIINLALWLISFIALIMTIFTFYMIFFSDNEAWIKKAKWNLVGIFIALGIIWLAWIIVSFIFRWYETNWKSEETNIQTGNISMQYQANEQNNNQIYLVI